MLTLHTARLIIFSLCHRFNTVAGPLLYGAVVALLLPSLGTVAYQ